MADARPAAAKRLPHLKHLDGLRVVFCLAIHLQHLKAWDPQRAEFIREYDSVRGTDGPGRFEHILHNSSELGVSYFFVIGGFLAFYTAATKPTASWGERKEYLWKRLARLLPTFWVSGIMYVLLTEVYQGAKAKPSCVGPERPADARECALSTAGAGNFAWAVFLYTFALQDILPIPQGIYVNEPAWFVSAICFCYIAYICLHKYIVRSTLSFRRLSLVLLSVILARSVPKLFFFLPCKLSREDVYRPMVDIHLHRAPPFHVDDTLYWNSLFYLSPVVRFLEFLSGALVGKLALHEVVKARLGSNRKHAEIGSDAAFAFGAIWILYIYTGRGCQARLRGSGDLFGHCLPLALWMLMATHSKPEDGDYPYYGVVNKMLACKPLVALSPWTYAAYMYQANVMVYIKHTGFLFEWATDAKFAIIVFLWFAGGVMYTILEVPAAAWLLKHAPSAERSLLSMQDSSLVVETQLSESVIESVPLVPREGQLTDSYGTIAKEASLDDTQERAATTEETPISTSSNSIQEP